MIINNFGTDPRIVKEEVPTTKGFIVHIINRKLSNVRLTASSSNVLGHMALLQRGVRNESLEGLLPREMTILDFFTDRGYLIDDDDYFIRWLSLMDEYIAVDKKGILLDECHSLKTFIKETMRILK